MDQVKIGKFISAKRKEKNLTQAELAEKLNITDRAISKWETGKGMPDTSIMLDLCEVLSISVNELLSGEVIVMENYNEKAESLLIQMADQEVKKNKSLILAMWTIITTCLISMLSILLFIINTIPKGTVQDIASIITVVLVLIPMFIALRLEVNAGYYECKKCHHRFVPSYNEALFAMHMVTTRHLKCPECGTRSWCKKVMSKKD